jgi:hypothetical protein
VSSFTVAVLFPRQQDVGAQVAKTAASLARLGRSGTSSPLGNIAPKPAKVGKGKLGSTSILSGRREPKELVHQVQALDRFDQFEHKS